MAQNSDGSAKKRRRGKGRPIPKGTTLNPGGRPKTPPELAEAFRARTMKSLEVLDKVQSDYLRGNYVDEEGREHQAPKPGEAVKAAEVTLDRGWGTAPVKMELTGKDGKPIATDSKVKHVIDSGRIARILSVLQRAGALQAGDTDDAETDEVHPVGANGDAGGVPPP
jgi:hypothetical protein